MWLVALLTERGVPLAKAGVVLSAFFLCLALGRAATAALARSASDRVWVPAGLAMGAVGAALGGRGATWGYLLAGFSFGPVYPLVMARLSAEREETVRDDLAFVYAAMVVVIAVGHRLMGWTAEAVSPTAAGPCRPLPPRRPRGLAAKKPPAAGPESLLLALSRGGASGPGGFPGPSGCSWRSRRRRDGRLPREPLSLLVRDDLGSESPARAST